MAADRIFPIVIFSVLFLALTLAVVPQMVDVLYTNAVNSDISPKAGSFTVIGGHQYQMWSTTEAGGITNYTVTGNVTEWGSWANQALNSVPAGPNPILNTRVHYDFWDQGADDPADHKLSVWIVRNNTEYNNHLSSLSDSEPFIQTNGMRDFVFFREYAYSGALWDNQRSFFDVVSFAELLNPARNVDNSNMTSFSVLGKFNITFFLGPTPGSSLSLVNATLFNQFTIQVGSDMMNLASRGHIGMWNIVGYLFLFDSEELGMPSWLNGVISTILWICVGITVVGLVSRFIPTIPGL